MPTNNNSHHGNGGTRTGVSPGSTKLPVTSFAHVRNDMATLGMCLPTIGPRTGTCPVAGCRNLIPASVLMCVRHWSMLPPYLQRTLASFYSLGQTTDLKYVGAYEEALGAIAWEEKQRVGTGGGRRRS